MRTVYDLEHPLFDISMIPHPLQVKDLDVWLRATKRIFEEYGYLPPAWSFFCEYPEGVAQVLFTPKLDFNDSSVKSKCAEAIRDFVEKFQVRSYCFSSEAWVINRDKVDCSDVPSEQPDRMERLLVLYETKDTHSMFFAQINEEDGKRVPGEWEEMPEGHSGGRFAGILYRKDVS